MSDRNTSLPILARRSSLPLDPPPYQAQSSAMATSSSPKPAAGSAHSNSDRHRPETTSPLLFRDPTFPMRDPSSSSSSSHQTHTLSTPANHTAMSSSSHSSASSSSSWQDQPPSTAPSTPQLGLGGPSRTWRPTPNVPLSMRQRHRVDARNPAESGEQHRWLSEDEGTGGPSKMAGRRKRDHRSSNSRQHHQDGYGSSGGGAGGDRGAGSSTLARRPTTGRTKTKPPDRTEAAFDAVSQHKRPQARRAISMELRSSSPATLPDVGAQPPRIEDLIPPPTSPVAIARGLGSGTTSTYTTHVSDGRSITHDPAEGDQSVIPDFASGRGGDGTGGVGHPGQGEQGDRKTLAQDSYRKQRDTLGKLRGILGCVLCPSEPDEPIPFMHRPLTLPCGHTLSADHISIATPAPIYIDPSLPEHEIIELQQRQQQQRLSLWSGVMCPIPGCKRYSPTATTAKYRPTQVLDQDFSFEDHVSSGAERNGLLASGVAYYPPAPIPPPDYSPNPALETGSPLIDVNVEKIIRIVHREAARLDEETINTTTALGKVELNDPQDEIMLHDALESPSSDISGSSSNIGRAPLKKQRNHLDLNPEHDESQRTDQYYRRSDPDPLELLKKDMLSVLECDVCAMLLHEPVTTPCQHSFCSKCLSRSLDHSSRCPVCRQDLPSFAFFQDHAINKVLLTIIKTVFGPEYEDRAATVARDERDALLDTPIFVCTLAFPGMPTILHVFEPRYRLMIRRCIESSNPRFGMVLPARGGGPPHLQGVMEYGTMLEIQSVQMLPDGRSMVETVGAHRFKLLEKGSLDGYTVGRIEKIQDITPDEEREFEAAAMEAARNRPTPAPSPSPAPAPAAQSIQLPTSNPNVSTTHPIPMQLPAAPVSGPVPGAGPTPLEDTAHTTEEYMTICRAFIDQLRSGSAPWLLQRLNNTYGTMPEDPSEFSYWMALVMPIDEYEKARLLPIRSPRLRLKLIVHWIDSLRSSWWFSSGCVVG